MSVRLSSTTRLPASVGRYTYDRDALASGIVHLGIGAFHKAHQAVYTDGAMDDRGGDWMITGVSLRSGDVADALNPQDGLYTLLVRGADGVSARVIGSIRRVLVAPREPDAVLAALAAPETRIVSLTITEKGYGIDPATGGLDRRHASIAPDLADPRHPSGAVGFIVEGLRLRRERGLEPYTVLCCDNLPHNGKLLRRLVTEFAEIVDPGLAAFVSERVTFPSTMVDRITPASTEATYRDAERLIGRIDLAAVETEPFAQWVIEPNRRVAEAVRREVPGAPIIGFPPGAAAMIPAYVAEVKPDALGLDYMMPVWVAAGTVKAGLPVQGNLDPLRLLAGGAQMEERTEEIIAAFADRPHIFNLGHGIVPETPIAHVERLIEIVKRGR